VFRFFIDIFTILFSKVPLEKRNLLARLLILQTENYLLKRKLEQQHKRISFTLFFKFIFSLISIITEKFRKHLTLVSPKTVLKWYHDFIRKRWTYLSAKKPGRPETPLYIKELILAMKKKNLNWGNKKIQGELLKLGIELDKKTIAKIVAEFRRRGKVQEGPTWKQFIKSHMDTLFAMDFCTITSIFGKVYYIFFLISLKTREIVRYGVTDMPSSRYVALQLQDWREFKYDEKVQLIHDNDPMFGCISYKGIGITDIATSVGAPNMNAFAERFVRTLRNEALDWFIIFSYEQLYEIVKRFVKYYNTKRPHQGLDQKIPAGYSPQKEGKIVSQPVLSGLHHHYERKAS